MMDYACFSNVDSESCTDGEFEFLDMTAITGKKDTAGTYGILGLAYGDDTLTSFAQNLFAQNSDFSKTLSWQLVADNDGSSVLTVGD